MENFSLRVKSNEKSKETGLIGAIRVTSCPSNKIVQQKQQFLTFKSLNPSQWYQSSRPFNPGRQIAVQAAKHVAKITVPSEPLMFPRNFVYASESPRDTAFYIADTNTGCSRDANVTVVVEENIQRGTPGNAERYAIRHGECQCAA